MQWKKYLVVFVALALLLVLSGVTSAQYEHVITDAEDDVDYIVDQSWTYNVERPNIDIVRAEISEGGEGVIVSLTVKGEITDAPNIEYGIYFGDSEDSSYIVHYSDGICTLYIDTAEGMEILEPEATGAGTNTLSVDISLEDLHNPESLEFTEVMTWEYIDEESEYYWDTADPDDTDDNDVTDPDDDDTIIDDDDLPEFVEDWFERGMMCLALGVIIVVVIVIIIIVVIIKLVKKDDKGGEQPPRQEYQQPPPPARSSQEPEMQYQGAPPPEETGGEISPGEDIMEEEEF